MPCGIPFEPVFFIHQLNDLLNRYKRNPNDSDIVTIL